MKCCIVKDLLPNYIDGLNSEETNAELTKHLDECVDCRTVCERMATAIPQVLQSENNGIDFLKNLKSKIFRKNVIVAISTSIIVLGGLLIFANTYEIPIPYDPSRMTVALVPVAVISNADGSSAWRELSTINTPEGNTITTGTKMLKDHEYVADRLSLIYQGFSNISESRIGRSLNRKGETVRVVYYCYTKTPWVSLFFDYDLENYHSEGSSSGTDIYGDGYGSVDYEPQKIEIYYLPTKNLHKLYNFSDEDYDAQREKGILLWNGVI